MIQINDSIQLDDLHALHLLMKGLEVRFPDHNGPFEYATRLAEEVGELVEVLHEIKDGDITDAQKAHLTGEQIDVIRTVLGIAEIYGVADKLPRNFDDYEEVKSPANDCIALLTIACGELASAVNHAEGMGVKKEKHGDDVGQRILDKSHTLIQMTLWTARIYDVEDVLRDTIVTRYNHDSSKGYIHHPNAILDK